MNGESSNANGFVSIDCVNPNCDGLFTPVGSLKITGFFYCHFVSKHDGMGIFLCPCLRNATSDSSQIFSSHFGNRDGLCAFSYHHLLTEKTAGELVSPYHLYFQA